MHVKVLDERVVERAKARGLDALVYAPHFTRLPEIESRAAQFSDDELTVVPARELFTGNWQQRRHVLAVGLSDPVPDFLTLEGTMEELKRQNAAALVPHPGFLNVSLTREEIRAHRDRIDAVEVYNPKHWPHHNRRAKALASDFDIEPFTSSYAHVRGTVGEAWVSFDREIDDADDLVGALREGAPRRVFHRDGLAHRLRCGLEFCHLGYENSWSKVDRLLLQGTEPTHPNHVAYGGRFDDVKVY
ncbi:PHP domain-containing protein [Halomicrobium sp. IBSBa]|uniref:PHP domain-containing protein n=1 Tax=Halomicrobium sp. IBSBa TaxID=2778916 RepID=UPI001ABF679C|nr:PHP domain-containing protein [Halomicrobium sp. IBSBa]MBO4246756.1 PHP domain-containing protein [Halomicrobium sp. IBSBa]